MSSMIELAPLLVALKRWEAATRTTGMSSPGNSYWLSSSRTSISTSSMSSSSSTMSHLFRQRRWPARRPDEQGGRAPWSAASGRRWRDHEDRAVHLRCTGDHVLDVVGVTGAVDVGVVPAFCLVLDVRDRDGDTALTLFRGLVDHVERREGVDVGVTIVQHLCDSSSQRGLAMVNVTNGADVDVRLVPLKLGLRHLRTPSVLCRPAIRGSVIGSVFFCCISMIRGYSPRAFAMISVCDGRGTCA